MANEDRVHRNSNIVKFIVTFTLGFLSNSIFSRLEAGRYDGILVIIVLLSFLFFLMFLALFPKKT